MKSEIQKILNKKELEVIKKLSNPQKIQDFLDKLPFNFESNGETYMSPRRVLNERKAHCFEGAIFAHFCLTYHGFKNFLVDLKVKKSAKDDFDHTISIFEQNGFWGAISKTNHSVLRWRDPIYKDPRELAVSYFHEYFLDDGVKTLDSYSKPFNVFRKFNLDWITSLKDLDKVALHLDHSLHFKFVPTKNKKMIRKVGKVEVKGSLVAEWRQIGSKVRKML